MEERNVKTEMDQPKYYFPVVIEKNPTGFSVQVVGLEDVLTVGATLEEAEVNAREAIQGHIGMMDPQELEPYKKKPEEATLRILEI